MIPRRAIFLLSGLLAAPAVMALDEFPPVGTIDFYGIRKASLEQLREALAIREGDPAPNGPEAVREAVARLQRVRHVARAAIDITCCEEGRSILFVGVEEKGAPRPAHHPRPTSDIRLPEEIFSAYNLLIEAWMAAVLRGDAQDDLSQGHSLSSDPECRRIQEQLVSLAGPNEAILRRVLREARDDGQRAAAAWVIGYLPDKRAAAAELEYAMRDPDGTVRNHAVRGLGAIAHYGRLHPGLGIRMSYPILVVMLDSIVWSDRNKALFVLLEITVEPNRDLIVALRGHAVPALVEMARFRSRFARPAFTLLGRVAGMTDAAIDSAWDRNRREVELAAMLSRIGPT